MPSLAENMWVEIENKQKTPKKTLYNLPGFTFIAIGRVEVSFEMKPFLSLVIGGTTIDGAPLPTCICYDIW